MAGNVGRIFGGGFGSNVNGYMQPHGKKEEEVQQQPVPEKLEPTELSEDKIFEFLANSVVAAPKPVVPGAADEEMTARITESMKQFDVIYSVIEKEFGEKAAPNVMNLVIDKLDLTGMI